MRWQVIGQLEQRTTAAHSRAAAAMTRARRGRAGSAPDAVTAA
jgi:hypothetical protein